MSFRDDVAGHPVPGYPDRTIRLPTPGPEACRPGTQCEFTQAVDDCTGDVFPHCRATLRFTEHDTNGTTLGCEEVIFDLPESGYGYCTLREDDGDIAEPYLARYELLLDRLGD
jgi:hypothetical protein